MKYIVIDDCGTDIYDSEFENKEEAIKEAEYKFNHMTPGDKKRTKELYVLESANPDPDAENHFDGDIVKRWI